MSDNVKDEPAHPAEAQLKEALSQLSGSQQELVMVRDELERTQDALQVMTDSYTAEINKSQQALVANKRMERQLARAQDQLKALQMLNLPNKNAGLKNDLKGSAAPAALTPTVTPPPEPKPTEGKSDDE